MTEEHPAQRLLMIAGGLEHPLSQPGAQQHETGNPGLQIPEPAQAPTRQPVEGLSRLEPDRHAIVVTERIKYPIE